MKTLGKLFKGSQQKISSSNLKLAGSNANSANEIATPATDTSTPTKLSSSLFSKLSLKKLKSEKSTPEAPPVPSSQSTGSIASFNNNAQSIVPEASGDNRATLSRGHSVVSSKSNLSKVSKTSERDAQNMKEVFKKLVTYDCIIKVTPPTVEGPGPWSDGFDISPVLSRKNNPETQVTEHHPVHVMTIGRPQLNPNTNEEERRIKLYEHTIHIENMKEVVEKLNSRPEEALIHVDHILRYPQSEIKLTDKFMTKPAAIRSLSVAQISLVPLFGSWLNPQLCAEEDVKACSTTVFLCGHCPDHGTVARVLKPMEANCDREAVKEHLMTMMATVLDTYWENHPNTGWAMCVTVPPGLKGEDIFY